MPYLYYIFFACFAVEKGGLGMKKLVKPRKVKKNVKFYVQEATSNIICCTQVK